MGYVGSLHEWARFLDASTNEEASAVLLGFSRRIDAAYDDLGPLVGKLFESPTGEVADVLLMARTALADAASMLDSVRARFDSGERESV